MDSQYRMSYTRLRKVFAQVSTFVKTFAKQVFWGAPHFGRKRLAMDPSNLVLVGT